MIWGYRGVVDDAQGGTRRAQQILPTVPRWLAVCLPRPAAASLRAKVPAVAGSGQRVQVFTYSYILRREAEMGLEKKTFYWDLRMIQITD